MVPVPRAVQSVAAVLLAGERDGGGAALAASVLLHARSRSAGAPHASSSSTKYYEYYYLGSAVGRYLRGRSSAVKFSIVLSCQNRAEPARWEKCTVHGAAVGARWCSAAGRLGGCAPLLVRFWGAECTRQPGRWGVWTSVAQQPVSAAETGCSRVRHGPCAPRCQWAGTQGRHEAAVGQPEREASTHAAG